MSEGGHIRIGIDGSLTLRAGDNEMHIDALGCRLVSKREVLLTVEADGIHMKASPIAPTSDP